MLNNYIAYRDRYYLIILFPFLYSYFFIYYREINYHISIHQSMQYFDYNKFSCKLSNSLFQKLRNKVPTRNIKIVKKYPRLINIITAFETLVTAKQERICHGCLVELLSRLCVKNFQFGWSRGRAIIKIYSRDRTGRMRK